MSDPAVPLLEGARADGCEFGLTLANHLPMVLLALQEMGAGPLRLDAYAQWYRAANEIGPPPPRIAPVDWTNWQEHLGDRRRESDFRAFFTAEVARHGAEAVERRALPVLLPGIAASALHALMRLAYAHRFGIVSEIGTSLGYWAATFLPLRGGADSPPDADTEDPVTVLQRVALLRHLLDIRPDTDLLWHAMRAVSGDALFTAELDRFAVNPHAASRSLSAIASAAAALYAGTLDFCALHAVTGAHWIRLLPETVCDHAIALRHFWRAIAAVMPKMGMPTPPDREAVAAMRATPAPPWETIFAAAIISDDEHDHSLVFSAYEEWRHRGDELYRVLAARRMALA